VADGGADAITVHGRTRNARYRTAADWDAIAAIAAAVGGVLREHAGFAAAARRRAVERFDVRPWLDRHAALFDELVARAPRV